MFKSAKILPVMILGLVFGQVRTTTLPASFVLRGIHVDALCAPHTSTQQHFHSSLLSQGQNHEDPLAHLLTCSQRMR